MNYNTNQWTIFNYPSGAGGKVLATYFSQFKKMAHWSAQSLTPAEAKSRFGVGNLAAEASRLRQHGFAVYANQRTAGNGVKVTEYVLGKPSRKIVAAGYKALALGLV